MNYPRSRRDVYLLAGPVLLAAAVFSLAPSRLGAGVAAASGSDQKIHVAASGLPSALQASFFLDQPVNGGGYLRLRALGGGSVVDTTVAPGGTVEAGPIPISNTERWYPVDRFRAIAAGQSDLQFVYRHEYMVTMSKWSSGSAPIGTVMGDLSRTTGWVADGTSVEVTATPKPGWRFLHWGLFTSSLRLDPQRVSAVTATLRITVEHPIYLVASFGQ